MQEPSQSGPVFELRFFRNQSAIKIKNAIQKQAPEVSIDSSCLKVFERVKGVVNYNAHLNDHATVFLQ